MSNDDGDSKNSNSKSDNVLIGGDVFNSLFLILNRRRLSTSRINDITGPNSLIQV